MKTNKILIGISYVVLSITIITLILSILCIVIKNSEYFNEEKYFNSERFSYNYLMSLRDVSDELIHNNSSYDSIKDGEIEIYRLYNYKDYFNMENINFLIIYKNKAITNVNENTIDEIKKQIDLTIESNKNKKVNIIDTKIQTDSQSISKYGNKYLNNFLITYYTTNTNKTDNMLTDGRYIEYITANIDDFEIYSSYKEQLSQKAEIEMTSKFLEIVKPINDNAYVIFPVSSILTILLILYLVMVIGNDTVAINSFDNIPIEIVIFVGMLISCIPFIMLEFVENNYEAITSVAVTAYFVIYICTSIIITTIIRRIKAKQFFRTSITGKILIWWLQICKQIINKMKEIWETLTYSANITSKVIISTSIAIFIWIVISLIFGNAFPIIVIGFICFGIYKIIKVLKEYSQI